MATVLPLSQASFQKPKWVVPTTWAEHAPFAFWLVEAHRPQCITELGTLNGFSYFCFCEKIRDIGLQAKCFAVDTWQGDEHQGFYSGEVYDTLLRYNEAQYADFSRLIRATFDEAVNQFADGSIDLLHIDGRHFYEDVKHDFETWQPKLSSRAIVLFHDTQVRERGFGVFKFWQEISGEFPHFEFTHGFGLGVLGVGRDDAVSALPIFQAKDEAEIAAVRGAYERLGAAVSSRRPLIRNENCPCGSEKRFKHCHGQFV